ncbi:hypothetical protein [Pseudotabrizicola sp. 4114]|uniref:hypothetical protein n=1 Tax=Pseudotabrizicola sp. 4114 TaxID=2817731 RepID=UPI00285FB0BA|nr:hypothetical protein [Pseudorhodobacter sp. 4114]
MISFRDTTDATLVYRETSALQTLRMDRTSDTGSLLGVIRNSVIVIGSAKALRSNEKVPESPLGTMEAVSQI